jgi:hypothetical protein
MDYFVGRDKWSGALHCVRRLVRFFCARDAVRNAAVRGLVLCRVGKCWSDSSKLKCVFNLVDLGSERLAAVQFGGRKWPRLAQVGSATTWPRHLLVLGWGPQCECVVCAFSTRLVVAAARCFSRLCTLSNFYCLQCRFVLFYYFQLLHPGYPIYGTSVWPSWEPPCGCMVKWTFPWSNYRVQHQFRTVLTCLFYLTILLYFLTCW